jgi:hypothetical protein
LKFFSRFAPQVSVPSYFMGMSPPSPSACPRCGTPLQDNRVDGLCASCLAALNFAADSVITGSAKPHVPSLTPEELAPHFAQLEILQCLGRGAWASFTRRGKSR